MTVRVHLADDHAMFKEGLLAILASQEGKEVVGSTSTGPEAARDATRARAPGSPDGAAAFGARQGAKGGG
jgi:DNA-binding NarL/FixJ family response regulator